MPSPSRIQIFLNGGTGEQSSVLALPPFFSDKGSANVRLSKNGEVSLIDGYVQINTQDIGTIGGQLIRVTGLHRYNSIDGTVHSWVLVGDDGVDEVEVYHSLDDGVTWNRLATLGPDAVGIIPDLAQLDNEIQITFGDGSTPAQSYNGTTCVTAGQARPALLTVATSPVDGVLQGIYQYKQADIDDAGIVGPASPTIIEPIVIDDTRVDVSDIQVPGVGSKGTRIFRTTGDGGVFYTLVDLVDGETVYEDNIADLDLLSRQAEIVNAGDPPQDTWEFVEDHRGRQFYADRTTIYPSDLNRGDSIPLSNSFQVGQGQDAGDEIVGMSGDFRGDLIVWKEQSVYRLSGDGRQTWDLIRSSASQGAVTHRAVALVPAGARYIDETGEPGQTATPVYAYLSADQKIRIYDGDNDIVISGPVQETVMQLDHSTRRAAVAVRVPDYEWVLFYLPVVGGDFVTVAWDYARGVMHADATQAYPDSGVLAGGDSATDDQVILSGSIDLDGKVYKLAFGTTNDGADRTAAVRLKPFEGGVPGIQKIMRDIETYHKGITGAQTTLDLNIYEGFVDVGGTPFVTLDFSSLAVPAGDVLVSTGQQEVMNAAGRYPVQMAFVFEWQYVGQDEWSLLGITPGITPAAAAPARTRTA